MTEAALFASSSRTGSVANSVVSELTSGTVKSGSNADALVQVVSGIASVAEGVGEATETVG